MVTVPSSSGWRRTSSRLRSELRQLVEKQEAIVRKGHLARAGHDTSADQARIGNRRVRRAKQPSPDEPHARIERAVTRLGLSARARMCVR